LSARFFSIGLSIGAALVAVGLAAWAWRVWSASTQERASAATSSVTIAPANVVQLSPAKLAAADLHTSVAEVRPLQETRRVPGTIGYNKARRLEVTMPVAGVVQQVFAEPGQSVKRGDRLAQLTSIEVGVARDEVVNAEAELALAEKEGQRAVQVHEHLGELLGALNDRLDVAELEKMFDDKTLGEHRDRIITAYSKWLLAEKTVKDTESVAGEGIASIVVRERRSAREVAAAALESAREQSEFVALEAKMRSEAKLEHAQRMLTVSRRKLSVLLGPFAEIAPGSINDELCELILRAPTDGLIEDRLVTVGAHVVPGQVLFAIADTSTLWVTAQIYEREWAALSERRVSEIALESPAVADRRLLAKVLYVAVSASPETRAVPLVAEFANEDGRFKPGMFAWVELPMGAPREALAVPPSAVTRHEQRSFVFVEDAPGTYRRVDVAVGRETPDWIEITHGLKAGEKIVDRGAFVLKSELLLAGEEE
jgi:RND family efflux transporter MFP subunit